MKMMMFRQFIITGMSKIADFHGFANCSYEGTEKLRKPLFPDWGIKAYFFAIAKTNSTDYCRFVANYQK